MSNTNTNKMSISPIITALEAAFDWLNNRFYEGSLPRPVITLSEGAKARAMGWFSLYKPWHLADDPLVEATELNISSDYLDGGYEEVVNTLCHEMVHCYNYEHGIKDCARSGSRHNKKFAETAEAHGMRWVKPTEDDEAEQQYYKKYGFAHVKLNDAVRPEVLEALTFLKEAMTVYRDKRKKKERVAKKSGVIKYMCPCCGNSVRATKEVMIMCMDCKEAMVQSL